MILRGVNAVVTGSSSGLGQRVAERLATEGVNVGLLGRNKDRLHAVAARCEAAGVRTHCRAGEMRDAALVIEALDEIAAQMGPTGILVNCAGVSLTTRLRMGDIPLALWDEMQETNVRGTYLTCNHLAPKMRQRGEGAIVNIGSTGSHVALPGVSAYAASKFAVRAITNSMAQEYDGTGVRVCMVSSGPIDTPYWDRRPTPPTPTERQAMLRPDDIADAIIWLVTRPKGVRVDEILMRPARQTPLDIV